MVRSRRIVRLMEAIFFIVLPLVYFLLLGNQYLALYNDTIMPRMGYSDKTRKLPKAAVAVVFEVEDIASDSCYFEIQARYEPYREDSGIVYVSESPRLLSRLTAMHAPSNRSSLHTSFDVFGAAFFPLDIYEASLTFGLNDCPSLDVTVLTQLPSNFVAEVTEVNRTLVDRSITVGNETYSLKTLVDLRARIWREPTTMSMYLVYTAVPAVSIYVVLMLTTTAVEKRQERLKIYSGMILTVFAYFFTIRQLATSHITWTESVLSLLVMGFLFVESARHPRKE